MHTLLQMSLYVHACSVANASVRARSCLSKLTSRVIKCVSADTQQCNCMRMHFKHSHTRIHKNTRTYTTRTHTYIHTHLRRHGRRAHSLKQHMYNHICVCTNMTLSYFLTYSDDVGKDDEICSRLIGMCIHIFMCFSRTFLSVYFACV